MDEISYEIYKGKAGILQQNLQKNFFFGGGGVVLNTNTHAERTSLIFNRARNLKMISLKNLIFSTIDFSQRHKNWDSVKCAIGSAVLLVWSPPHTWSGPRGT